MLAFKEQPVMYLGVRGHVFGCYGYRFRLFSTIMIFDFRIVLTVCHFLVFNE